MELPSTAAWPINVNANGVKFQLQLLGHVTAEVLLGALRVEWSQFSEHGARDVSSLISCEAQACGRFIVSFDGGLSSSHVWLPLSGNSSSQDRTVSANS